MKKYLHSGFLNNVEITLIDKTDPLDPKRREGFWRTKHPWV